MQHVAAYAFTAPINTQKRLTADAGIYGFCRDKHGLSHTYCSVRTNQQQTKGPTWISYDVEGVGLEKRISDVYYQHVFVIPTLDIQESMHEDPASGRGVIPSEEGRFQPVPVDLEGDNAIPVS